MIGPDHGPDHGSDHGSDHELHHELAHGSNRIKDSHLVLARGGGGGGEGVRGLLLYDFWQFR